MAGWVASQVGARCIVGQDVEGPLALLALLRDAVQWLYLVHGRLGVVLGRLLDLEGKEDGLVVP